MQPHSCLEYRYSIFRGMQYPVLCSLLCSVGWQLLVPTGHAACQLFREDRRARGSRQPFTALKVECACPRRAPRPSIHGPCKPAFVVCWSGLARCPASKMLLTLELEFLDLL